MHNASARHTTSLFASMVALALLTACSDGNDSFVEIEPLAPLGVQATLDSGPIEGQASERAVAWEYLGLPFAAPPVGELRWRAPQPEEPWSDVREAKALPNFCPQVPYFTTDFAGSEDCLYLNVFRPQTQERDLPVFVWIHGGGNNNGDSGQLTPAYDGARLAERGNMVVVTVQYRLGALGWLYHPALQTGDALDSSGNYGTLDLIAALEWVQANAPAFGGDPENVSIVGESAGAANVLTLLISPEASGLFHKGVVQSLGGRVNSTADGLSQSADLVDALQALSGITETSMTDAETADFLRSFDPETILSAATTSEIYGDGSVIPEAGFGLFDSGDFVNKVPLIVGTNKDEYKLYTNPLGFNEYPDGSDELREAVGSFLSDAWRVTGADTLATRLRAIDDMPAVYVYRFNWGSVDENGQSPLPGDFGSSGGAFHSSEIPFMMANEDVFIFEDFTPFFYIDSNAESRAVMSDIMVSYWSSFAWMSDPNAANLPIWEPWQNQSDGFKAVTLDVSNLDNSPRVEPDATVLTAEAVYAEANATLQGEVLAEVLRRLDGWFGANL